MSTLLGSATIDDSIGHNPEALFNGSNLFFGFNALNPTKAVGTDPKRHYLTISPTRGGKGTSFIIPNLLTYRGSCIVIDPKGENAWITSKARREFCGNDTAVLDPWGEVNRRYAEKVGDKNDLENGCRYNPLSILDPKDDNYADDLAYLADALIINQSKDPHWDNSARELVAGLMAFLVETSPNNANLNALRILLSKPSDEITHIAERARNLGPESVAARKLGRFAVDSKENASIISTALTQTSFLDSSALSKHMSSSDISFNELTEGRPLTIYLVLPVDKLQTHGRWLRLLISIAIRTVARNSAKLSLPVLFILDEFGTVGRLSAVAQAYGLMAGLQLCLWAFVQDLTQLKHDYPDEWETFIGNSDIVTGFGLMDQTTCEYFSRVLGKTTVERVSQATKNQREGTFFFSTANPDYASMNDQVFQRDLLTPEEIRGASSDRGFLFWRGNPVILRLVPYYNVPKMVERARKNPYFITPEKILFDTRFKTIQDVVTFLETKGYKFERIPEKKGLLKKTLPRLKIVTPNGVHLEHTYHEDIMTWAYNEIKSLGF